MFFFCISFSRNFGYSFVCFVYLAVRATSVVIQEWLISKTLRYVKWDTAVNWFARCCCWLLADNRLLGHNEPKPSVGPVLNLIQHNDIDQNVPVCKVSSFCPVYFSSLATQFRDILKPSSVLSRLRACTMATAHASRCVDGCTCNSVPKCGV